MLHSLRLVEGYMPIQPFLELATIFGLLTLLAYWVDRRGYRLNKLLQATVALAIVFWYMKYRLYPPLPFSIVVTDVFVIALAIFGWVSSSEAYWKDFCLPIIAVLDGNTTQTRAIRTVLIVVLPLSLGLWTYSTLLPPDPSTNRPLDLRTYHPAPPQSITVYSPEDFPW